MKKRIQVRLNVDLTEYREGLIVGSEGYTVGSLGIWSRNSDRFIGVHFPGIGTLDVLWKSLEIIDKEYLRELEKYNNRQKQELKSATNVVRYVGPRGGFRHLSYEYVNSDGIKVSISNGFKQESEKLIEQFNEYNIIVQTKTID